MNKEVFDLIDKKKEEISNISLANKIKYFQEMENNNKYFKIFINEIFSKDNKYGKNFVNNFLLSFFTIRFWFMQKISYKKSFLRRTIHLRFAELLIHSLFFRFNLEINYYLFAYEYDIISHIKQYYK